MSSLAQVATALQTVLTETAAAGGRSTGFVRRAGKLDGARFVQTLVFGWLADPAASLHQLTQTAAALGVALSPQGLDQRFTPAAAALLERVLAAAVRAAVSADPVAVPLLQRFGEVIVQDSTTIALPDALGEVWPGCGGRTPTGTAAAVKLQVRLDLVRGRLDGPVLTPGRAQDKASPLLRVAVVRDRCASRTWGTGACRSCARWARRGVGGCRGCRPRSPSSMPAAPSGTCRAGWRRKGRPRWMSR